MQSLTQTMRVLAAILLILGFCRAEAAAVAGTSNEIQSRKIIFDMDIDNFIDENMDTIRNVAWELDPMELDDVNFPLTKHIYMYLHTGWAQNIAELQRSGKCRMTYSDKKLNIDLNLGWEDVVFDYQYVIRLLLTTRKGDLHGQMTKLNAHIALEINFHNYHVTLKSLDLEEKGQINLSLEGHMLDWVYNIAIKTVTHIFQTMTLKTIREKLRGMIVHRIDELNFKVGSMMGQGEFTFVDLAKSMILNNEHLVYNAVDDNHNTIN